MERAMAHTSSSIVRAHVGCVRTHRSHFQYREARVDRRPSDELSELALLVLSSMSTSGRPLRSDAHMRTLGHRLYYSQDHCATEVYRDVGPRSLDIELS
jgi:hypothetical protein